MIIPRTKRGRTLAVVGVLAVLVATSVTVVRLRAGTNEAPIQEDFCVYSRLRRLGDEEAFRNQMRAEKAQNPGPGEQIVTVAPWDPTIHWEFTHVTSERGAATPVVRESTGVFKPAAERDVVETEFDLDTKTGQRTVMRTYRFVLVGEKVWFKSTPGLTSDWSKCDIQLGEKEINPVEKDLEVGRWQPIVTPYDILNIGPGPMKIDPTQTSTDPNTGLTTYRQVPDRRFEWIDIRVTLDERNQLRAVEIKDPERGVSYQSTMVRPAPDHPPVVDPTGQPLPTLPR